MLIQLLYWSEPNIRLNYFKNQWKKIKNHNQLNHESISMKELLFQLIVCVVPREFIFLTLHCCSALLCTKCFDERKKWKPLTNSILRPPMRLIGVGKL